MSDDVVSLSEMVQGGESAIAKSFGYVRMDDLADSQQLPNWLIKDVMEVGTHGMLFGDPESGKTLVLFDIAYCIASGKKWRNRRVKQGAVFYICGEGHGGLGRRAKAWRLENNIDPEDKFPFYTSEVPASLLEEDSAMSVGNEILSMIEALKVKPALIVLDTLARNFGPGDENSAVDMGKVISHIDKYLITDEMAVITSHHTGHGNKDRARGSMAMMGALDVCYKISKDDNGRILMDCTKSKDFSRPLPFAMRLKVNNLGVEDEDGHEVTGATVHHTIYDAGDDVPDLTGFKAECYDELRQQYLRTLRINEANGKSGEDALPMIDRAYWRQEMIKRMIGPDVSPAHDKYDRAKRKVNRAITALIEGDYVRERKGAGGFIYPTHDESDGVY